MAGTGGIEPPPGRLTAACSTSELHSNLVPSRGFEPRAIRLQGGFSTAGAMTADMVARAGLEPATSGL